MYDTKYLSFLTKPPPIKISFVPVSLRHTPVVLLHSSHRHFSKHCIPWYPEGHGLTHSIPKEPMHANSEII